MTSILNIENLNKSFDGITPVKDASFSVSRHSIVLITGENGAGKTTLFNLITGLEKPTKGKIYFNGYSIANLSPLAVSRLGILRLYQQPRVFKNLLVWENLVSAASYKKENLLHFIFKSRTKKKEDTLLKQKALELLAKFNLQNLSNRIAGELSYGQQKLISFCMIAMNGAKLVLLDEPFAGLNPQTIEHFSKMVLKMKAEGFTLLIIEHNVNKALAICDSHIEMIEGRIKVINNISNPL